ncbi:MAG: YdcF family protein [Beijerinckiaceae bacterium]
MRIVRLTMLLALSILVGGFFSFAAHIDRKDHAAPPRSDGIVVLTGGTDRIPDGARLMTDGYGRRMLISGVNTKTTADDLARLHTDLRDFSTCCVDLGYQALNTRGNAIEARRWARLHDLKSLIIVTSDYHMPRTIAEFRAAMPDVRLAPHPVISDARAATAWWQDVTTARLVITEYLKYLAATGRILYEGYRGAPPAQTLPHTQRAETRYDSSPDAAPTLIARHSPTGLTDQQ